MNHEQTITKENITPNVVVSPKQQQMEAEVPQPKSILMPAKSSKSATTKVMSPRKKSIVSTSPVAKHKRSSMRLAQIKKENKALRKAGKVDYEKNIAELEKELQRITNELKQKESTLAEIQDDTFMLTRQNRELEISIEKMTDAAVATGKKFTEIQNDFDERDRERNQFWKFRFMEVQYELEDLLNV